MDTYQSICSTLKTSLSDAGLSEKSYYGEQQLKPALLSFLNRLEAIGHKVCGDFNSFGLLCALQHYVPSPIMLPQQGFEPDAQVTFNNAAAFAFRFSSATKDAKIKLTPADYRKLSKSSDLSWVHTYSKVIEEVYSIVSVIEHTVRTLRCLGKGDEATVDFCSDDIATILQARPSEELEQKLRNYDERLLRTQNILIFYGLPIGVGKGESPLKGVTVNLNFAQYREGHMDAPPVAKVFDMEGVYVATTLHSDEVIRIFNTRVHAEDLFVFLAALFKPQVEQAQQGERFPGLGVMIFMIMAGATAFSQIMAFSGVTRGIVALVSGLDVPPPPDPHNDAAYLAGYGFFHGSIRHNDGGYPYIFPHHHCFGF